MTTVIFIFAMIGAAVLGAALGFGRTLKLFVNGIFGLVISVAVCFMIGGTVRNVDSVREFIDSIGLFGSIVYYALLFIAVTILRRLVVRLFCTMDGKGGAAKEVSRVFGAVFAFGFCYALTLLFLAAVKAFENTSFAAEILLKIQDTILWKLYENNPIII